MSTFRSRQRTNQRRDGRSPAAPPDNAVPEQAQPATPAAPAPRPPRAERPDPRRNAPSRGEPPAQRPAFERRNAEPRRRDAAPAALAMFAPCPRGLETVLAAELARIGAGDIVAVDGGAGFSGTPDTLMRANLESRVASRVLLRVAQGPYRSERDINALALTVDWPARFAVERTIKVQTDGVGARVNSLDFISLTVKDAVCDRFRQAGLGRPNVDTRNPDVRIRVFVEAEQVSLYLDTSGEALFKRGWRREHGEAPLRENLAAGILGLAGYDGSQPLLDPMCGSGTFLIEAADIALNRAPGRMRHFAFERLSDFDADAWQRVREAVRAAERPAAPLAIAGSDHDPRMVALAEANLARAGLAGGVTLTACDLFDARPHGEHGLIVTNPPYGVRLEELDTLAAFYPKLGDWLKQHFAGWTANLFTGDLRLAKLLHLAVKRRIPLYNGAIDCRLFVVPLVAGSARQPRDD